MTARALSYDLLTLEVQQAARLLATLVPAPIPLALIEAMPDRFPTAVRTMLVSRSFVTRGSGPDGPPLFGTMHRVLGEFLRLRSDLEVTHSELAREVRDAVLCVMTDERCQDPGSWPLMTACLPHAEWLLHMPIDAMAEMPQAAVQTIVSLLLRGGMLLWSHGEYQRARTFEERAVAQATRLLGPEHPATRTSLNDLATTLYHLGDLRGAEALMQRAHEGQVRVLGDAHPHPQQRARNLAFIRSHL